MNRSDIDWSYVRRHTLLPGMTALISVLLLITGSWIDHEQKRQYTQFSSHQDVVHQDYDALVYRRRLIDRYHRRYQQFHDMGFVGRESRLDWIEALRSASRTLTLPRLSYAIEPQLQVLTPVDSVPGSEEIQIHLSRLELEMGLVHEIDLLRIIDQLQRTAPGLIKVDHCTLTWQGERSDVIAVDANILANCSIQIFSVVTSDISDTVAAL